MYSREQRRNKERRQQHADPRTKSERPAQRVNEQPQIAGVTDDAIDTARCQRMTRLDGYQSAEPAAEHEDWPDAQRATGSEQNNASPESTRRIIASATRAA